MKNNVHNRNDDLSQAVKLLYTNFKSNVMKNYKQI